MLVDSGVERTGMSATVLGDRHTTSAGMTA